MRASWVSLLMLGLPLMAASFRFYDEGSRGPDFLGEAGLNAVPRLGRRSLGTNPFGGNRFRFRFNGLDGFRFNDEDSDKMMSLRKRAMEEAMASDNAKLTAAGDKSNPKRVIKGPSTVIEQEADEVKEDLDALSQADKYWREFLNDIARKNVLEKLLQYEKEAAIEPGVISKSYGTPLQNYLARSMGKMKQAAASESKGLEKYDNYRSNFSLRGNFK